MLDVGPNANGSNQPRGRIGEALLASICEVPAARLYHLQWHRLRLWHGRGTIHCAIQALPGAHDSTTATAARRIIIGCFVDGHMRGAAELRALSATRHRDAQILLSVEPAWQGCGIGTALMADAVRIGRQRNIEHLHLTCHALNRRVQRIAEKLGARVGFEGCECFAEIAVGSRAYAASP